MNPEMFSKFPIECALFFVFLFVLCGALAGHFLYYDRNLIGFSAIIGSVLLLAGLLFWLI